MRTSFAGFFLAAGMGFIVLLLGLGALSMAGLVSFVPKELVAQPTEEPFGCAVGESFTDRVTVSYTPASPDEAQGDALFKANCVQCHAIDEKVVGPALAGITKRRSISWLIPWVRNSAKVIASGDDYAVKLYNDNGKQQMPSFGLSEKEITNIILYIEASRGYQTVADHAPVAVN